MRHEFLDEQSRKVKDFAQALLDEHVVLVSVHYVFLQSYSRLVDMLQQQQTEPKSLPQKIKTVLEFSARDKQESKKNELLHNGTFSFSGQVIATGSKVTSLRPGDIVACVRSGQMYYTDLMCVSEYDAVIISDKTKIIQASVTGFALLAMHAINRAKLRIGDYVCIGGFGAFGYLLMSLAQLSGATVIVVDDDEQHLKIARQSGASLCFNTQEPGWEKEVLSATQQHGVDVTLIADSHTTGFDSHRIIDITRSHGRIVLVGVDDIHVDHAVLGSKDIDFCVAAPHHTCPHNELYQQHNTIVPFIKWKQRVTMQKIVRLIEHDELALDRLTSLCIDISKGSQTYFNDQVAMGLGIIVSMIASDNTEISESSIKRTKKNSEKTRFMPAIRDSVRVGIIGADAFVQHTLMPTLTRIGDVTVNAIVDIEHARATRVSHLFGVARTCFMDSELLQEDGVDAVVIASNTLFQADRVISALEQHKAVFVKEPIATSFAQYERLNNTLITYPDVPLCVDYHRSYAPFIRKIKEAVSKRSTPLMMHYRVNACTSMYCQDKENAVVGSIVGEACHFIDLFCYLTNAQPVAVSVEAIHAMRDDVFPTDNFAAQISFDDGSVCSLMYTSLGHERFGGEHLELFFDSKVIVMKDFLMLQGYGLSSWFDEVVSVADTGREHLINTFFRGLREVPFAVPMSKERILSVAHITLVIDQLACAGGGSKQLTL